MDISEVENWLKCALAVKETRSGIICFVREEIEKLKNDILRQVCKSIGLANSTYCGKCETYNLFKCPIKGICDKSGKNCSFHEIGHTPQPCPNKLCDGFVTQLMKLYRNGKCHWQNTDAKLWYTDSWQLAKCFMPESGYKDANSAENTDFNGIVYVILNCKHFDKLFSCDLTAKHNLCEKVSS